MSVDDGEATLLLTTSTIKIKKRKWDLVVVVDTIVEKFVAPKDNVYKLQNCQTHAISYLRHEENLFVTST